MSDEFARRRRTTLMGAAIAITIAVVVALSTRLYDNTEPAPAPEVGKAETAGKLDERGRDTGVRDLMTGWLEEHATFDYTIASTNWDHPSRAIGFTVLAEMDEAAEHGPGTTRLIVEPVAMSAEEFVEFAEGIGAEMQGATQSEDPEQTVKSISEQCEMFLAEGAKGDNQFFSVYASLSQYSTGEPDQAMVILYDSPTLDPS